MRNISVEFGETKIENPALRMLVVIAALAVAAVAILLVAAVVVVASPFIAITHLGLIALGRKGFYSDDGDGHAKFKITIEGFRKREHTLPDLENDSETL